MSAKNTANPDACLRQAIVELQRRHSLGEAQACESVLADFPQLCGQREAVLELVYSEFVLCQEANRPISAEALQARFPEYQDDLKKILSVDQVFRSATDTPSSSITTVGGELAGQLADDFVQDLVFDHLGDYDLLEIIGEGGMGIVYRARQRRLNRMVAVKTIDSLSSLNPAAVTRFHAEAELVAKLRHPNIVQVYEVGSKLGVPYFSMELVSGGTLAEATQERPLTPLTAAKIVEILARAVHYAHSQSVIHRDLKPANILLSPNDCTRAIDVPTVAQLATLNSQLQSTCYEPKIADFGLGKFLEGAIDSTATQGLIGTPSFMAPEQVDPELGTVGPACDIYSLGAILYDAMTGTPPFNAATVIETLQKVRTTEVIPPSKLQSKIPRDLETICLKCLRKEPTKRYQSAKDLADDLQRFLTGKPILARPAGVIERNWKWARRHPSLAALFAAVMLASVGMTLLWLRSEHSRWGEQAALQRNDRLLYDRDIGLAQFEYESNRIDRSREILAQTRPEYRGWEWDYLDQQNNQAIWESSKLRDQVAGADISRDGRLVAASTIETNEIHPEAIHVWDIEKNELLWKLEGYESATLRDVRFSSDGVWLLTAGSLLSRDGKAGVKLWDMSNGTLKQTITKQSAEACQFSPDGKSIFIGDVSGWVTEYSFENKDGVAGKKVRKYQCTPKGTASGIQSVLDIEFNPDGSRMAVASRAYEVTLWDTTTGKKLQSLGNQASSGIHKIAWSPNGKILSLAKWSGARRLFQFQDDRIVELDKEWGHHFNAGEFTPDGRYFVSAEGGKSIEIQNASTGIFERTIRAHNGTIRAVAFDASGRFMLTGGSDSRLRVWDLANPDRRQLETRISYSRMSDLVISPSSREIAAAFSRTANGIPRIDIRDATSHKVIAELQGHTKSPTCLAYSTDGKTLLSGSDDKTVRVWDSSNGQSLAVLEGHQASLHAVHSMDNSRCVSVDAAGVVIVWDLNSKKIEKSWQLEAKPQGIGFHPQLPIMAVACKGYGSSFWDVGGKKLFQLPVAGDCSLLCFSPNGRRLATVENDSTTLVWSMEEKLTQSNPPSILCKLSKQSRQIRDISFSPDGKRLISCSRDARFLLSDTDTGHELLTLESSRNSDGLVSISPDGKTIVRIITGKIRTWSTADTDVVEPQESTRLSSIAWHAREAASAVKAQDWFAARFHQDYLTKLEPDNVSHFLGRADSRMRLDDFAGAEEDLLRCDGKVAAKSQRGLEINLFRAYLGQQKWPQYREIYERVFQGLKDASSSNELNTLLWFGVLDGRSNLDLSTTHSKLKESVKDPKSHLAAYMNTLALSHYRRHEYQQAIACSKESIRLSKDKPAPCDWMILALSYAQWDQQRIGWLPNVLRSVIRRWGWSSQWNSSLDYMAKVDAWIAHQEESLQEGRLLDYALFCFLKTEFPQLKKEWEEIESSNGSESY